MLETLRKSTEQTKIKFITIYFVKEENLNNTLIELPTGTVIQLDDNTLLMTMEHYTDFQHLFEGTRVYGDRILTQSE